ncbi:bifunctional diaminohydroxyphosphoribosylaminopyrimidine deaminase/5-amino-6-(5-phosphoribosylamino)uracil reductase RibD [Desulfatibacillum alkenivorans]|jgi:diaminohydroxyphosphoribosylaminopyrimidine deaminase/5-amino-6-(5-phosphoribosylamino)uracil reductase|nr:bifunctional diaminohydroxyphosphoribosylaminopyrimidine deaminase/5-amino-6-(5-phosphoribosylamino)uracil reductase RibD [Desulfatibacillum alkenivorans]
MKKQDTQYMRQALALAEKGTGSTSPNPMVGAIIVKDGKVIGQGWHKKAGGPHAEIFALEEAGADAKGATMYVTLEPCNHHGKTPPCSHAVLKQGIAKVIAAMKDPNPKAQGGLEYLQENGVETQWGVCEAEARRLNEFFIKHVTTGRPFVVCKCAATLDGRIATRIGDSKWITGEESRACVHKMRHAMDAILVGINTVRMDDPSLTARLEDGEGNDPLRVILDSRLSMDPNAKMLRQDSDSGTLIFCGPQAPEAKREALVKAGAEIVEAPEMSGFLNLDFICRHLGEKGLNSLLIEGGGHVHSSALKSGVVDKVCLFYAPKILCGDDGVPMFAGPGPDFMADSIALKDITLHRFGNDFMVEGYVMDLFDERD